MRRHLKREIEVFFSEILLTTLETKSNMSITYHQKLALLKSIAALVASPCTLIEIHLNYDCDPNALDNLYERIVIIMSKILTSRDLKLLQTAPALPPGENVDVSGFGVAISPLPTVSTNSFFAEQKAARENDHSSENAAFIVPENIR
eukprot:Partr_v1_DN28897_c2_g1_i3_m34061